MNRTELLRDEKAQASLTLGDVIKQTAKNYPDSRFHARVYEQTPHYTIAGIDPAPYSFWVTADGIGTKPELAERLYTESQKLGTPTPEVYEGLAFDTLAMIDGDEARFRRYMVGVAVDTVFPDPEGVTSLLQLANTFPQDTKRQLKIDDRIACEQWNRGVGFIVVTENREEAKKLVEISENMHYEAAVAGEIIDKAEIHWRGHVWQYR